LSIMKTPRFSPAAPLAGASASSHVPNASEPQGLDAFASEVDRAAEPRAVAISGPVSKPSTTSASAAVKWIGVSLLSAALTVAGVLGYQRRFAPRAPEGSVTLETVPAGLDVMLAGQSLGKTPITTSLRPGSYDLQVGSAPNARTIALNVVAGTSLVERVEFVAAPQASLGTATGPPIETEPTHPASVQPQGTVSLVASAAPALDPMAVSAGWLTVSSPVTLELSEDGKLIGTSASPRLSLKAGDHDIEFYNEALGFVVRRTVRVAPGRTSLTRIDLPNGMVNINAQPWAEVWIDGERIGVTPIENLSRRIGRHEVVLRHPEFGERRETVVITVGKAARIGVDLRKP
jgi:hypothetical protein